MTISDRLDEMRQEVPGCALVSFGDLSTGLALRTSAARQLKQDYLEEVLDQAARTFALSDMMQEGQDRVVVATADEVRVFVRLAEAQADVICCVCDAPPDFGKVTSSAHQILSDMAGGG